MSIVSERVSWNCCWSRWRRSLYQESEILGFTWRAREAILTYHTYSLIGYPPTLWTSTMCSIDGLTALIYFDVSLYCIPDHTASIPNSESKPCGKSRQKHIFRIQHIVQCATCSQDTEVLLEIECSTNSTLAHLNMFGSGGQSPWAATVSIISCIHKWYQEMDSVVRSDRVVIHGPDTLTIFRNFQPMQSLKRWK